MKNVVQLIENNSKSLINFKRFDIINHLIPQFVEKIKQIKI